MVKDKKNITEIFCNQLNMDDLFRSQCQVGVYGFQQIC